ncbi:MAG TPA: nuclear transport factor 2 family protein, partial [Vicinamibacterales bacterium]|nr:nuclear transport factor 2 family protein [Vicinamibacterales bacterium]
MAASVISRKEAATSFLRQCAAGNARQAFSTYAGEGFRHHNVFFPGTADALMNAMDENARQNPQKTIDILHSIEEGDLVALHSRVHLQPGDRGIALVHLFRFNKDRVVELWD